MEATTNTTVLHIGQHEVLIDTADIERASELKWNVWTQMQRGKPRRYVAASRWGGTIYMHRFLLNAPDGYLVDHRNGNGLDNRRCNIRVATNAQNLMNAAKRLGTSSEFKGVSFHRTKGKYQAYIRIKGKLVSLGYSEDPVECARRYDAAAAKAFGSFAKLNFEGG